MFAATQTIDIRTDATGAGTTPYVGVSSSGTNYFDNAQSFNSANIQQIHNVSLYLAAVKGSLATYRIDIGANLGDVAGSAVCSSNTQQPTDTAGAGTTLIFTFAANSCNVTASTTYYYHIVRATSNTNNYLTLYTTGGTDYESSTYYRHYGTNNAAYPSSATTEDIASTIKGIDLSVTPTPFFEVTAKDADTTATLSDITVTLANGTQYTNASGTIVVTPFNNSEILNFTVSVANYFNISYINWNSSYDLQVNLTQYPYVYVYNKYDNSSVNASVVIDGQTYYSGSSGVYVPYNSSQTVTVSKTNYFTTGQTHDFTGSNDLNTSIYQARINFNAYEIITENVVNPANFSIAGDKKTNSQYFYLDAGTYAVTFSAAGYFNKIASFNITAGQNETLNFTAVSGSIISATAKEFYLFTDINAFNITISNSQYSYYENYEVTAGEVNISILQGVAFYLNVSASGYLSQNVTINTTYSLYNQTFYLYRDNAVILNFYDEQTLAPVNNVSFLIYAVNAVGYGLDSETGATNNSILIEDIPSGFYGIEYGTGNYTVRNYFINIPFGLTSETNLSLYLLDSGEAASFVVTTTDTNNRPLQDIYGSVLRRYVIGGQTVYKVVDMFKPSYSLQGAAPFTAEANNVAYLFRVQEDDGTVLYQGAATTSDNYETLYLIDSQLYLKVQTSGNAFDVYQDLNGFSYSFVNTTQRTFWLSWTDTESAITQICLNVKANNTQQVSNQCSTADAGILSYTAAASNSTYYVGRVIVTATADNKARTIDLLTLNYEALAKSTSNLFGYLGIFILVLTLIASGIAGAINPPVAIITAAASVLAFSPMLLGFAYISLVMQGTVLIVGLIAAWLVGGAK